MGGFLVIGPPFRVSSRLVFLGRCEYIHVRAGARIPARGGPEKL
ncbi:MAG: hypothetical protein ACI9UU_001853, partial [Candidatus Azotimanducaceae bacterium]